MPPKTTKALLVSTDDKIQTIESPNAYEYLDFPRLFRLAHKLLVALEDSPEETPPINRMATLILMAGGLSVGDPIFGNVIFFSDDGQSHADNGVKNVDIDPGFVQFCQECAEGQHGTDPDALLKAFSERFGEPTAISSARLMAEIPKETITQQQFDDFVTPREGQSLILISQSKYDQQDTRIHFPYYADLYPPIAEDKELAEAIIYGDSMLWGLEPNWRLEWMPTPKVTEYLWSADLYEIVGFALDLAHGTTLGDAKPIRQFVSQSDFEVRGEQVFFKRDPTKKEVEELSPMYVVEGRRVRYQNYEEWAQEQEVS